MTVTSSLLLGFFIGLIVTGILWVLLSRIPDQYEEISPRPLPRKRPKNKKGRVSINDDNGYIRRRLWEDEE